MPVPAPDPAVLHPVTGQERVVFLRPLVRSANVEVGEYTYYDSYGDPLAFERDHGGDGSGARAHRRRARPAGTVSMADSRLERLFGDGATAFGAAFEFVPDPVGVLWAIREPGGAIANFETGYSNPTMARMIGVATEASIGRRLLEEAPELREDETFTRMRDVLESGRPEVVEIAVESGQMGRSGECGGLRGSVGRATERRRPQHVRRPHGGPALRHPRGAVTRGASQRPLSRSAALSRPPQRRRDTSRPP
jgi:hypothetical protein